MTWRKPLSRLGPFFGLAMFAVALFLLRRELHHLHVRDVIARLGDVPGWTMAIALAATAVSYLLLMQYDALAVHYIGASVPYRRTSLAGYLGYAFTQNIGMSILSGAPVRFRLYSAHGLSAVEIATLLAFNSATLWLGMVTAAGLSFVITGGTVPGGFHLPLAPLRLVGVALLLLAASYVVLCARRRQPFVIGKWQLQLPSPRLASAQLALGCLDWLSAAVVLYVLLPDQLPGNFAHFVSIFILAHLAGALSQVPGGIGVFETVIVLLLHASTAQNEAVASLVVYRVVYYLLPLAVAAVMLLVFELHERRVAVGRTVRRVGGWLPALAPSMLAIFTFAGGTVLLIFGSLPSAPARLRWLGDVVPLAVLELSHFLGSVVGLGLLLLAWSLRRRLEAAWVAASALLGVGVVLALTRGLHVEAAAFLALMLAAMLPARRFFYRRTPLLSEPLAAGWLVAVAMVVIGSSWLGFFAFRHVAYSRELWWQFALDGNAPRFLRASVGVALGFAALGLVRLLGPTAPREAEPGEETDALVSAVVESSPVAAARLAYLGDKRFLIANSGRAFVMYAVQGRSWVAMGDPVGPLEEHTELIWRYHLLANSHGGLTVFHEVGEESLPIYVDLGLSVLKIGEEASVDLETFDLEGHARKPLRHVHRRAEKEGSSFEVVPAAGVPPLLGELRAISEAWLADKRTREKRFSLGRFDEAYLARLPVALVRHGGRVVAFATLWPGAAGGELSIDLMRYLPDAPVGVMDYLFVSLMQWGRQQHFSSFNLGMAPLSGLRTGPFSPLWNRLAAIVYRYGEHFYNFQGLRQYKEKFQPSWHPHYLVCPGGAALPSVLTDLAALISGGLIGALRK